MAMGLLETLWISTGMFVLVLLVLLFVWALHPPKKRKSNVKEDLKKIKDQINGE